MIQVWFAPRENPTASPWFLAGLVVCCLIPRAAMALKLDAVCNDAVFYVDLARRYEQGDLEGGIGRLGLNVYPPVLAAMHRLGVGWEDAGKWWGVAVASLAVLPLFGWIRRQFDGRTALAAVLLYAFHPKLIEWSPELLRDPTFWLLWTLGLYASWRATQETTLRWYFVAGLAIAVAAHTRFEGWFLYIPLIGWSVTRRWQTGLTGKTAATSRKLLGGVLVSAAISPLLVVLINITLLRDLSRWELGNFDRLDYVAQWFEATWSATTLPASPPPQANASERVESPPAPFQPAVFPWAGDAVVRMPVSRMLRLYGNALRRGFGALFGLLWLVGIVVGCGRLLRADHAILFLVAGCLAAAAWIHLWYGQATSSRYFLAIVLLACPCSAIGGTWIYDRLLALFARLQDVGWRRPAATAAIVLATVAAGVGESLADRHDGRLREAELGRWLLAAFGPSSRIATIGPMPRIGFYAHITATALSPAQVALIDFCGDEAFDAIVAQRPGANQAGLDQVVDRVRTSGYQEVDRGRLPGGYDWSDFVVLVRLRRRDSNLGGASVGNALRGVPQTTRLTSLEARGTPQRAFPTEFPTRLFSRDREVGGRAP